MILSPSAWAKPLAASEIASRVKAADAAFRVQDFEKTIALLKPLALSAKLKNQPLKIKILERLGASYWLGGQPDAARSTFTRLWQLKIAHQLDKLFYPPELISFFNKERSRLKLLGFIGKKTTRPPAEPPKKMKTLRITRTITDRKVPTIAYLMPFGVGQFVNGRQGRGTVIAVLQGIGLVGNIATWFAIQSMKGPGGQILTSQIGQAELLQGLWWGATGLFATAYIYGVVDGLIHRPKERTETIKQETIRKADTPKTSMGMFPVTGGVGIGFQGAF